MTARPGLPDPAAAAVPLAPAIAQRLPAAGQPWAVDFDALPPGEAQRLRLVLARGARPDQPALLLADRSCVPLLLQTLERRLAAPLRWLVLDGPALDDLLAGGEAGFRALGTLDPLQPPTAGDDGGAIPVHELSAARLADATSPVVRLLDATLFDALQEGASDVHIESTARGAAIRSRIDGVLGPARELAGVRQAEQLVSRLKVMAELDIGERRLPQDGRFKLRVRGREVDFRLSVIPSVFGEDAVVRVLDRQQIERTHGSLSLAALGLAPALREQLLALARAPHGMLLVTGPTGSGKTTTLYALLTDTQRPGDKTVTIEDPVEYMLAGTTQIPVHEGRGLGFARGLRAVLRHDPDRIMVGEIRDAETAAIAVQAALTGHVVLSTVHANGVFDVIGRFMHMGLDPYHVVGALNGVLAQRLLRCVCPQCSRAHAPTDAERAALGPLAAGADWRRGGGCPHCHGSGLRGRRAVAELLVFDDALRDAVTRRAPLAELKDAGRRAGWRPLREAALALVAAGLTTLEEADRVSRDG